MVGTPGQNGTMNQQYNEINFSHCNLLLLLIKRVKVTVSTSLMRKLLIGSPEVQPIYAMRTKYH
jgi:hypothetical protein